MRSLCLFLIFALSLLPSARSLAMDDTKSVFREVVETECDEGADICDKAQVKSSCFSRLVSNKWFKGLFILLTVFSFPAMAATAQMPNPHNGALTLYAPPRFQSATETGVLTEDQINLEMQKRISAYMRTYFQDLARFEPEPPKSETAVVAYEGSQFFGLELSAIQGRAEQIGSLGALQQLRDTTIMDFSPAARPASDLLKTTNMLLDRMDRANSIGRLYYVLTGFPHAPIDFSELSTGEMQQLLALYAALRTLLEFNVGLKTIDLLLPEHHFKVEKEVLTKFYRDEKHPMDLQKFLRHPVKSQEAIAVVRNLSLLMKRLDFKANPWLEQENVGAFNDFMKRFIKMRPRKITKQTLLDLLSVPPNSQTIRVSNIEYYRALDISLKMIIRDLTFSLNPSQGIYLFHSDQTPTVMEGKKFHVDRIQHQVYLRVPDAHNRVVQISREGYKALRKIRVQSELDRLDIEARMKELFEDQTVVVSARTKSARSILDKAGRLAESVDKTSPKYTSVLDIIDINGFRITCFDSSQIISVISKLQDAGFQILELDNKYNTIRKDGAYKVLPLTLLDPKTRNIFELQITTMPSTTVTDLFHNAIYKKDAVGLNLTDGQREFVLKAQRAGAILETLNLFDKEYDLARPMNAKQREKVLLKLKQNGVSTSNAH